MRTCFRIVGMTVFFLAGCLTAHAQTDYTKDEALSMQLDAALASAAAQTDFNNALVRYNDLYGTAANSAAYYYAHPEIFLNQDGSKNATGLTYYNAMTNAFVWLGKAHDKLYDDPGAQVAIDLGSDEFSDGDDAYQLGDWDTSYRDSYSAWQYYKASSDYSALAQACEDEALTELQKCMAISGGGTSGG